MDRVFYVQIAAIAVPAAVSSESPSKSGSSAQWAFGPGSRLIVVPRAVRFQYERWSLGVRSGVKKQARPTIVQPRHGFGVRELRRAKVQAYLLITNEPPVAGGLQRLRDEVRALYDCAVLDCGAQLYSSFAAGRQHGHYRPGATRLAHGGLAGGDFGLLERQAGNEIFRTGLVQTHPAEERVEIA
jgi:hypothetical protein